MQESLKAKTLNGVVWSGIDNVANYSVSFVVGIVLARLLTPDDYGLIGITAVFTTVCQALINAGFTTALIRKKDASDNDYNTAFIVNLGMSILLYAVIFLAAPLIAEFFKRQELTSLTRVLSLGMIIGALALVQQTRLTKQINFKSQTKITMYASIISGGVGIGLAFGGLGVWALVVQQLLSQTIRTLLLWYVNKWMPKLRFSLVSFHELFSFGWKMMVSGLINNVWRELYQVVIGKFYSPASLGQYTRAGQFSTLFSSNLTGVVQRVTYPVLSNIQDDKVHMVAAYRKMIKTTMFVTVIGMLICISGSLYPLHAINLNMLQVQGRSDLFLGLEIVKKMIAIGPLMIGAIVGILPMLYAGIIVGIIAYFLNSYYSGKLLGYSSWMQIKDIAPSYGVAFLIALSVYFLKFLPFSSWVVLFIQMVLGVVVFFFLCKLTKSQEYQELMSMFLYYFRKFRIPYINS